MRHRLELFHQRRREGAKLDRVQCQRNLAGLGAGERQDLVDESFQFVDFFELTGKAAPDVLGRPRLKHGHLDLGPECGERRSKLVRECRAELTHFADRRLETRERVVERVSHGVEFIGGAADGQPLLQVVMSIVRAAAASEVSGASAQTRHPSADEGRREQSADSAPHQNLQRSSQQAVDWSHRRPDLEQITPVTGRVGCTLLEMRSLPRSVIYLVMPRIRSETPALRLA